MFDKFYNFNKKKLLPLNKGTAGKVALKSLQIVSKTLKLKKLTQKFPKASILCELFLSKRKLCLTNWIREINISVQKYSSRQIKESLNKLNIKKNDIVYVSGNLVSFGKPEMKNLNNLPKVFFDEIYRVIERDWLMFPTHSFDLVNNNKILI